MSQRRSSKKNLPTLLYREPSNRRSCLSTSGDQKKKTKAILALEVRLKTLSTRFENHEIDRKQHLEGL
jgi:hypothetical protein